MTTDENILEEMLERFTNSNNLEPDNTAMQMFLMVVKSNSGVVTKAHELIVKKINSPNTTEAIRAIELLEECMSNAGTEFQKKTAKFTFLNELIAVVLDKQKSGTKAPVETKRRIMECLMLWTVEHSDKVKIQGAYDNLKRQIDFEHGIMASTVSANQPITPVVQRSSILGKDDQLVAKLLKEGGEENYKKANLVIQRSFNQDARRTEFICHLKSGLRKIEDTMELLDEMLKSYCTETPGADSCEIIHELYNACKGHNEQMERWPDFLGDSEPEFLDDILTTKDLLVVALQRYREIFDIDISSKTAESIANHVLLVSNATKASKPTTTTQIAPANTDLLSELLGDVAINSSSSSCQTKETLKPNNIQPSALDELSEIFGSIEMTTEQTNYPADLLGNLDLLEPISVFGSEAAKSSPSLEKAAETTNGDEDTTKPQGFKELREIDKLSEEMFKESLQTELRQPTFKKEPEKITLNDLAKDKIQSSLKTSDRSDDKSSMDCKKSNEIVNKLKEKAKNVKQLECEEIETTKEVETSKSRDVTHIDPASVEKQSSEKIAECSNTLPLKPLAEITIDLDNVTPLQEGHRMLFDDGSIQVSLNFTADRPSAHVSVIVMTVTNKSRLPVRDFQFEASVLKPCKVRLLPPTDTKMDPVKPFRPSAPINQVILLLNPTQKSADLTCIVGYKLGEDPDAINEPIVAKDIPYV